MRTFLRDGLFTAFALVSLAGLLACGDVDASAPTVDVSVGAEGIQIPDTLAPGFTTFHIQGSDDAEHHLLFIKAKDGVTREQFTQLLQSDEDDISPYATIVGGNGVVAPGDSVDVTFELTPGLYEVVDLPNGEYKSDAVFTVNDGDSKATAPVSDGTIGLGPGLVFSVPSGFDGNGTFEVENKDTVTHEAAFVRLENGTTAEDLIAWGSGGFQGDPPPMNSAGGFGALDGGQRGWITADLKPGDYVLICFIVGDDGVPHFSKGMLTSFTVK